MTKEMLRQFIDKNVTFGSLTLGQGIFEYDITDRISIGISFESLDEYPYKRYIYNLFFDGEHVNINGCGTLKDSLPEEILEELERTYNTLT